MAAINYLTNWITWLLIIIPVGAGAMVTYSAFQKTLATDQDHINRYNTRIKQTVIGAIVATSLVGFITIIKTYYGM